MKQERIRGEHLNMHAALGRKFIEINLEVLSFSGIQLGKMVEVPFKGIKIKEGNVNFRGGLKGLDPQSVDQNISFSLS